MTAFPRRRSRRTLRALNVALAATMILVGGWLVDPGEASHMVGAVLLVYGGGVWFAG